MLLKPDKNITREENYGLIFLTNIDAKTFNEVLVYQIQNYLKRVVSLDLDLDLEFSY